VAVGRLGHLGPAIRPVLLRRVQHPDDDVPFLRLEQLDIPALIIIKIDVLKRKKKKNYYKNILSKRIPAFL
jgi:hypothetical protein